MLALSHSIALAPTEGQREYFTKAAGTARMVWNWALAEWDRQYTAGGKPSAMSLKKLFNLTKYTDHPWLKDIHRDAHSQPFANLGKAWVNYFRRLKNCKSSEHILGRPNFKKKGRCNDSFYVANDKIRVDGKRVRLPKIGWIKMTEPLRFPGKILGATVSRQADRWSISIQVDVPQEVHFLERTKSKTSGVDLGITAAVTLSCGRKAQSPKPLRAAQRRLRIRQRRMARKFAAAKTQAGFGANQPLPKGTRIEKSNNHAKLSMKVAKTHRRVSNIRLDFTHKLTTMLCRENQTLIMEDLNVRGMLKNHRLSRAISDIGFGRIRQQLEYKSRRYGTRLIFADRWFPSTKTCSDCGHVLKDLPLSKREWACPTCGSLHDRDVNAAVNLKNLAAPTALPVASPPNGGTVDGMPPHTVGKVTPVRHEHGYQSGSGQERKPVQTHVCTLF